MLKISAKAEYACLAVLELARHRADEAPVRIRAIAERHQIPERYLVQILLQLKGAGLVASTRGASGGYRLARPADRITFAEVLAAIDGPEEPPKPKHESVARALATVWNRVREAESSVLAQTTIAQVAAFAAPPEWTI